MLGGSEWMIFYNGISFEFEKRCMSCMLFLCIKYQISQLPYAGIIRVK